MLDPETLIGLAAAACTTASYIPQVRKTWVTRETGDLSLRMLMMLGAGLGLWCIYGIYRSDLALILANSVSLAMVATLIFLKNKNG